MDLQRLSGWQISEKIKNKELTLSQIEGFFKERIKLINPLLNSLIRVETLYRPDSEKGCSCSALGGVPIVIKDNICIKDKEVTCASNILKGFRSPYDASVIKRLKRAGLMILGISNMDEFAFGSSCENSAYGPCKNPWDKERVPGGSSGGSAAAVAAGLSPLALGSDTGGSIRQPASFCGVVGLKPTYGRVSRFGLVAFGSSLDQIGPLSRDITDTAHLLNIISGFDSNDTTSSSKEVPDFSAFLKADIKGKKIALPKEYFSTGVEPQVKQLVTEAVKLLESKGAQVTSISLPLSEYAVPTYYILASSEASSNLSRFDGLRYGKRQAAETLNLTYNKTRSKGLGNESKRRIMLGTFSLSSGYYQAYYLRALKVRSLFKKEFSRVFKHYQAVITPTSPTAAFRLGEKSEDPLSMYLSDVCTISANLAGLPAVSLPCGFTKDNLPVGLQILADSFSEQELINIAYSYQQSTDWHKIIPEDYE
jgi:aspartyl-tRNA(Asn)/glutamyl-tRNA(Gln) amidotransferase subunit A